MRLGIDIDDTITNTYDLVIQEVANHLEMPFDELREKNLSYDQLYEGSGFPPMSEQIFRVFSELVPIIPLKDDAKEYLDKLSNDGHELVFITARSHTLPGQNEKCLQNYNISYSKLIEGASSKVEFAKNENIDLFIDDSVKNCRNVKEAGIDVILFDAPYNKQCEDIKRASSWEEIYEYINTQRQ